MYFISPNEAIQEITFDIEMTAVASKKFAELGSWRTYLWDETLLSIDRNNHYFTATSTNGGHGASDAERVFALVFDDPVEFSDPMIYGTPLQDLVASVPNGPGKLSYVLETSPNNYQAGLLLDENALTIREANKLMTLIQEKLPAGSFDPGKAVRMARLSGINNKQKHLEANGGQPFLSNYTEWRPDNRFSVGSLMKLVGMTWEQLKQASAVTDSNLIIDSSHPLFSDGVLNVTGSNDKGVLIECPWQEEHTSGTTEGLVTLSENGVVGYNCFHGHCAQRKGWELLKYVESQNPGTISKHNAYKMKLKESEILQLRDRLSSWTDEELKGLLPVDLMQARTLFVAKQDKYIDVLTGMPLTRSAVNAKYAHVVKDPTKLLDGSEFNHVDDTTCDFGQPRIFTRDRVLYFNKFDPALLMDGVEGDYGPFIRHARWLLRDAFDHVMDAMACTVQQPWRKIQHMIIIGGAKGIGKDALLQPLIAHFGRYHKTIGTDELFNTFNPWLDGTKVLIINELYAPLKKERDDIHNRLKPLAAGPPETFPINQKNLAVFYVPNTVMAFATTNHSQPISLEDEARRFFMAYSPLAATPENQRLASDLYRWYEESDGLRKAIRFLQTRDISGFRPNEAPPQTTWMRAVGESSKTLLEHAIIEALEAQDSEGNYVFPPLMSATELRKVLQGWKLHTQDDLKIPAVRVLGMELRKRGYTQVIHNGRLKGVPARLWVLRDRKQIGEMPLKEQLALYFPVGEG